MTKHFKKIVSTVLSMLLMVTMLPAIHVFADYSGNCGPKGNEDSVTWSLSDDGVLTISGEGNMGDYRHHKAPWDLYKVSIKAVIIKDGVTSIGERAFSGCSGLTSVTYRGIITGGVFENCPLKVINVPSNFWEETFFGICVTRES